MWLWKKFWNTDIIGKIYILIILFIVVVATITVITRYKNASTNQFLDYAKIRLENLGYKVYFTGDNYTYNNATKIVKDNELLVEIKS